MFHGRREIVRGRVTAQREGFWNWGMREMEHEGFGRRGWIARGRKIVVCVGLSEGWGCTW